MGDLRLGLHAPTQGATTRFHQTAAALSAETFCWLSSEQPSDAHQYPGALSIVRLDNWHSGEDPGSYANRCAPRINAWFAVPNVVFQLGNEPELDEQPPHHGEAFPLYASRLRSMWHGIKLANPPLQAEHTRLWDEAVICAGDYLSCHAYWQINFPNDIENPNLGGAYKQLLHLDKPVIVTEVNAVPASGVASDTNVDWRERNAQVALWAASANLAGVHGCCIFIADAAADWAGFDVGPESARQIRELYDAYVDDSDEEETTVTVNASAVVAKAQSQIGHARSGGYDAHNGDHAWAFWCESFVESTHRNLGLSVQAERSAISAAHAADLNRGSPPLGSAVYFGTSFYSPDGHVGISMGDGRLLGTLTDGTGVGYRYWNEGTVGYLGWAFYPGVIAGGEVADPRPPATFWVPDNPFSPAADGRPVVLGGGFLRMWQSIDLGGEPLTVLGFPCENEERARIVDPDGTARVRTIQRFERAILEYAPGHAFPFDVTVVPLAATVEEAT